MEEKKKLLMMENNKALLIPVGEEDTTALLKLMGVKKKEAASTSTTPWFGAEVLLLTGACLLMVVLVVILHENMADEWTIDPASRTRVLVIAFILFCMSILVCYYTINRLGVKVCGPLRNENLLSTANHVHLVSRDLPPSYDSVICSIQFLPPPSYKEVSDRQQQVSIQIGRYGSLDPTSHHQATG